MILESIIGFWEPRNRFKMFKWMFEHFKWLTETVGSKAVSTNLKSIILFGDNTQKIAVV